ncbi:hypothetical protein DERF_008111, partial [Dermatophagoides farinae]
KKKLYSRSKGKDDEAKIASHQTTTSDDDDYEPKLAKKRKEKPSKIMATIKPCDHQSIECKVCHNIPVNRLIDFGFFKFVHSFIH